MKEMLLKFIEKTGKSSEFELFLDYIHKLPKMKFAVIKISGETLENHMDIIAEDIAYLNKLGIYPVVVHGAGSMLDKKISSSEKTNGMRVTSESDMEIVKEVFDDISNELINKIIKEGGSAAKVENVFDCEQISESNYVGVIKNVNILKINEYLENNITPIISPIGKQKDVFLNINADTAAKELVKVVSPKKFVIITETGGILDENNDVIPFLNLSSEEDLPSITGGMLLKINELIELLKIKTDCAVTITSAENLLKEIFTIKGSGTFIKYHVINSTPDINKLDKEKIKWVLEDSFRKKLVDNYFENGITGVFYQEDYEGVAIMKEINGIPYLDKFSVARFRQGTGLGKSIWNKVIKKYPKLIWRAAVDNPFNVTYMKNCDGMIKNPQWCVYWRNLSHDEIMSSVKLVLDKEMTMIKNGG